MAGAKGPPKGPPVAEEPAALRVERRPPVENPTTAASLDVVEAAPDVAEPSPQPLSPDAPIGAEERLPWPQADIEAARPIEIVEQPPEPAVEEPPVPAAAPPAVEEASPSVPSCSTSSGNGQSDFIGFDVSEPPLPLDRAAPAGIDARNLQAALDLAGAGFAIFAARLKWEGGRWKKKPIGSGWQLGTRDPERVRALWRAHPAAIPGIALGRVGLVVIDADRHGGPDGVAAFD